CPFRKTRRAARCSCITGTAKARSGWNTVMADRRRWGSRIQSRIDFCGVPTYTDLARHGASEVAQSCTLLYRRFAICEASEIGQRAGFACPADFKSAIQQIENLRTGLTHGGELESMGYRPIYENRRNQRLLREDGHTVLFCADVLEDSPARGWQAAQGLFRHAGTRFRWAHVPLPFGALRGREGPGALRQVGPRGTRMVPDHWPPADRRAGAHLQQFHEQARLARR